MSDTEDPDQTYRIVRFAHPARTAEGTPEREVIEEGLTLEEAQAHCADPASHVKDEFFDGYERE